MSLKAIQTDVHSLILNARRIERLIMAPAFETFFANLNDTERKEATYLIKSLDFAKVHEWFEHKLTKEIGELSYRELRIRASKLFISRYSLLTKEQLIREIIQVQNVKGSDTTEVRPSSKMERDTETSINQIPEVIESGGYYLPLPMVSGIALSAISGSPCIS